MGDKKKARKAAKRLAQRDGHPVMHEAVIDSLDRLMNTPTVLERPDSLKPLNDAFLEAVAEARGETLSPSADPEQPFTIELKVTYKGYGTLSQRLKMAGAICQTLRVSLHSEDVKVEMDGMPVEPLRWSAVD